MSTFLTMNVVTQAKTSANSGRMYRGTSHAARVEERRKKLLTAALEVVGTEGFKAATVRKVCAQAGLTERYYYEAFGNAQGMLKQLYEQQNSKLAATLYSAVSTVPSTPVAMAEASLTALFGAIKKDPRMARVIYVEIVGVNDELDEIYRQGQRRYDELVVKVSKPLYPAENIADLDELLIASALVGAITQVARDWVMADFDRSITSLVTNMMALAVGVITHLQNRKPA